MIKCALHVSFRNDLIPVPYRVSVFVYMIPDRVSFRNDLIPVHTEYLCLFTWQQLKTNSWTDESTHNELIPFIVAPDWNWIFVPGRKSGTEYHVKEVRAHSVTEIDTRIGWADQLTRIFRSDDVFASLSFQNEKFYVNVKWTLCVVLEWNSFSYHVNTN